MSRKLDVSLNQMFDLICNLKEDLNGVDFYHRRSIAEMVGNFKDGEVYAYINECAKDGTLTTIEAARRLNALASFRENYCEDLES